MGSRKAQCSSQVSADRSHRSTASQPDPLHPRYALLPEPSGPLDERFAYSLTDQGRAFLEETRRKARQKVLARQARAEGERAGTVCGRWRGGEGGRVPDLRLSGAWLAEAGFALGQGFVVQVAAGRLTIQAA